MNFSRRRFLHSTAGVATLAAIPGIVSGCVSFNKKNSGKKDSLLQKNDVILFQGDSITDSGREKERESANIARSMGYGYAFLAASKLMNELPEKELIIYNRGISGNKVHQLAERWDKDCLLLKPNLISILIGVNDYWHFRNGNYNGTVQTYEADYKSLLQLTKENLPEVKLVVCQPFALQNTSAVDESWLEPMRAYQVVAKKIADDYDSIWVPFQEVFDEAVKYAPEVYWAPDGVHPSMAGAQLMAEAWLRSIE